MFKSKTLFIVGAGASKEVNIPIGAELAQKIARLAHFEIEYGHFQKGDRRFFSCLLKAFGNNSNLNEYLPAARQISKGLCLANSIDDYINTHQNDKKISLLGKAAIVYTILEAEKKSTLYFDKMRSTEQIKFQTLKNNWYVEFVKILFGRVRRDELEGMFSNFSIACFNYDRCIQHFLISAIYTYFSIPHEEARILVEGLKIFHPYGSIGSLFPKGSTKGIEFGQSTDYLNIGELSKSIKTYTERVEENELLSNLRQEVAEAETIVFLGFGFHPQNMNILAPTTKTKTRRVYATALNISKPDSNEIKDQIFSTLNSVALPDYFSRKNIEVRNDLSCEKLFTEYQRTLAAN
jgi:hypothetical protein